MPLFSYAYWSGHDRYSASIEKAINKKPNPFLFRIITLSLQHANAGWRPHEESAAWQQPDDAYVNPGQGA
jgi:hypothetical protein